MTEPAADARFFAYHVGARDGTTQFPGFGRHAGDVVHVLFDADPDCVAQIEQAWQGRGHLVFPYCIAGREGRATLNLAYDPYASSLYPLGPQAGDFVLEMNRADYLLSDAGRAVRTVELEARTVDGLVAAAEVPAPDFLSMDVQGAELDILRGAETALHERCIGVIAEVHFAETYEAVPQFDAVHACLRDLGFCLAAFEPIAYGYGRAPIAARGRKLIPSADVTYLLDPGRIDPADRLRLEKLAFAAMAFGYTELAVHALRRRASDSGGARLGYQGFLDGFLDTVERLGEVPPLFSEVMTAEQSAARFAAADDKPAKAPPVRLRHLVRSDPLAALRLAGRYAQRRLGLRRRPAGGRDDDTPPSPVERYLSDHGFTRAAAEVRQRNRAFRSQKPFAPGPG